MPRAAMPAVTPEAEAAAARLVSAAQAFLTIGAGAFMSHGASLVEEAKAKGCKFAVRIVLPEGRARVDVVTVEGESVRLFEIIAASLPGAYPTSIKPPTSAGNIK